MNNTYIKRWIAGMLVIIMAASAAVFADSRSEVFHKTTKRSDHKELVPFTSSGPMKLQAPQKEEEEDPSVTVNITLKYDEDNYEPWFITTDCHYYGYGTPVSDYKSDETYQRQFSRNTHEMVALFMPLNRRDKTKYPILIAKDIDGLNDGETIIFDSSEATDLFEFVPVDEEDNPLPSLNDFKGGDTVIGLYSNTQSFGGTYVGISDIEGYDDPEQNIPYPGILTNPLSKTFSVQCTFIGKKWFSADFYLVQFPAVNTPGRYVNDKSLYLDHPNKFGITQLTKRLIENEEAYVWDSVQILAYCNGQCDAYDILSYHSFSYVDEDGVFHNPMINEGIAENYYKVCMPEVSMTGSDVFEWMFQDVFSEPIEGNATITTFMPPAFPRDGEIVYYPTNSVGFNGDAILGWYQYTLDNPKNEYFPKVNPNLVMTEKQLSTIPGNNTPILVSVLPYIEETGALPNEEFTNLIEDYVLDFSYIGRCLEKRQSDRMLAEVNEFDLGELYIIKVKNDNVLIDNEIQGTNTTTFGLMKESADFAPPTLQTLQIKDAEGNINDRINGPGSVMEIYAGDFYYYYYFDFDTYTPYDMMKCRPLAAMLVEYAPTGTTDYKEMTFTEDPEKFFLPGSGYFFSSPMDDILDNCSEGWYDLRITLMDEPGNFQEQVISPVFYVGEGVGIAQPKSETLKLTYADGIVSSSEPGVMTLWALDGSKLTESHTSTIDLNAYPHGVYIAKVKTGNGETMIKVAK